jgi:hypothetical protein
MLLFLLLLRSEGRQHNYDSPEYAAEENSSRNNNSIHKIRTKTIFTSSSSVPACFTCRCVSRSLSLSLCLCVSVPLPRFVLSSGNCVLQHQCMQVLPNCVAAVDFDALVQKREEERGISEFFLHILPFSLLSAREIPTFSPWYSSIFSSICVGYSALLLDLLSFSYLHGIFRSSPLFACLWFDIEIQSVAVVVLAAVFITAVAVVVTVMIYIYTWRFEILGVMLIIIAMIFFVRETRSFWSI